MHEIIELNKILKKCYKDKLVKGTSGNASFKTKEGLIYITKSGCSFSSPEFVLVSDKSSSSDVLLHKEIYRLSPVKWVIHVHKIWLIGDLNWVVSGHGVWAGFCKEVSFKEFVGKHNA